MSSWAQAQGTEPAQQAIKSNPLREAYYGDLHLHTTYSFDAYLVARTRTDPDGAYRFARGEVVEYLGQPVRRPEPLDFTAVTDHAELLGFANTLDDPASDLSRSPLGAALRGDLEQAWDAIGDWPSNYTPIRELDPRPAMRSAWRREIEAANRNYLPGRFTTFIGYEWTSQPGGISNLHRNVIFAGDSAPDPFTSADSVKPEDLWSWLEGLRRRGYEVLAIPHNANASNGLMFDWVDSSGAAIDRNYAQRRQANEPLSEISQSKGQSETSPALSANDEFASYEVFDFLEKYRGKAGAAAGSYLRDALGRGLVVQDKIGVNPFKYGFVGGSDQHTGLTVSAQSDYKGSPYSLNLGAGKASRAEAATILSPEASRTSEMAPLRTTLGNLTGVWAESNTRKSIFAALRRRETFATTGTRLRFRFFGGWYVSKGLLSRPNWVAEAYSRAVAMGSDLPPRPAQIAAPSFAVWAVKDPNGASLDRVQIIKVWEAAGEHREQIFDVAWSGPRRIDAATGKLPSVGNSVDLQTGRYDSSIGATELQAVWTDPNFDPRHGAAYYLRVLEIPTPRWPTLLAIDNKLPLPQDAPATIQQRGWSSPIWYTPPRGR